MQMEPENTKASLGPTLEAHEAHEANEDDEENNDDDSNFLSTISCDRCRHRKVRCDRKRPCSYCIRTGVPCTYPRRQKPKEKRQRVFISELYENKIDHIAKKLEEFGQALESMKSSPYSAPSASPFTPHSSSTAAASSNLTSGHHTTPSSSTSRAGSMLPTPTLKYEGESSLSAQAAFANQFLQDAVVNKPSVDITGEMASVLDSLSRTVGKHSSQQEADYLYPHARTLEHGFNIRNLPMPPVESAFICLRMAKEHPRVRFFWNHEANSISSFTEYFLKVYSPGDASYADLIIVNAGLYWLFLECKNATTDSQKQSDFEAQAIVCRDNLETVLSNLPFHQPSTVESTCAMFLAGMYCLDTCQPSAAWNFIATASHMCQTQGMHNIIAMAQDSNEDRTMKIKMFWLIYVQEKQLSLRLGRSSVIRDSDITVPHPIVDSRSDMAIFGQLHKWADLARLQGMVYDQIYSPAALIQPQAVRTSRARRLAAALEEHRTKIFAGERHYMEAMRHAIGENFYVAFLSTTRVTHLSLFCLIYRAIPAESNDSTIFGKECIASARQALEEHQRCMAVVTDIKEQFLETYVNWALLNSPFVPFIVLFCHIIETRNKSDLKLLEGLIETLQSASTDSFSIGIKKESRLFKVLYDVACSYLKLELKNTNAGMSQPVHDASLMVRQPDAALTPISMNPQGVAQTPFSSLEGSRVGPETMLGETPDWVTGYSGMTGDLSMEIDEQGAQLGNWLYMNDQMMRALEDSYF
ncbi:hypothetical protein EsH8_V_001147 [Colletotrichum jinshuiense]